MISRCAKALGFSVLSAVAFSGQAADKPSEPAVHGAKVHAPVRFGISRPMREVLAELEARRPNVGETNKPLEIPNQLVPDFLSNVGRIDASPDPRAQRVPSQVNAPAVDLSFDGFDNNDNIPIAGGLIAPPDTNGDVGLDFYIQYINLGWTVFNKADGTVASGPNPGNTFWSGFGGPCENNNNGDPVVLYDELADRWIFSQFTNPVSAGGAQCFAVSTTDDPLGPYAQYQFAIPGIDYPKIGIFSDGSDHSGYYFSTNNFANAGPSFSGVSLMVVDRDAMLAASPTATFIEFDIGTGFFAVQPGHVEGADTAAPGTCNVFIQSWDDEIFAGTTVPTDGYQMWELCPDFATPGNSVLNGPTLIASSMEWDNELCGFAACMPQPGTAQLLDTLSQFTMYRAAIRINPASDPTGMRLVVASTTDVGSDQAGLQWAEIDLDGLSSTIVDEGLFAPDMQNRWLPSLAMDQAGNIGIGYSLGSSTKEPSIYYTGRLASDTPGMLQAEEVCVDSTGVQTGTNRWVDYSSMSVDPVDNCTFWYTSEYYAATSARGWATRVCSFVFPSCVTPQVLINPTMNEDQLVCAGDPIAPVEFNVSISTGETDQVDLALNNVPTNFTLMLSAMSVNPNPDTVTVTGTVGGAVAAGDYSFDVDGTTMAMGIGPGTGTANITVFDAAPTASTLTAPFDGLLDATLTPSFSWSAVAGANSYQLEVSTDAGFSSIVIDETLSGTSFDTVTPLAAGTQHFWRVTAENPCGAGAASATFTFSTFVPGDAIILLVDDDDNTPDVRSFFTDALDSLALSYDVFDTGVSDTTEPDEATMALYEGVVWFTGDNFSTASTGPSPASETEILNYLNNENGCFFLSSQDFHWKSLGGSTGPGVTQFMTDAFGLNNGTGDTSNTVVQGENLFAGLGPYTLAFPVTDFSDDFEPVAAANGAFTGDGDRSAVGIFGPTFNTTWLGFPLPAIADPQDRADVLGRLLLDQCNVFAGVDTGELSGTVTVNSSGTGVSGATVIASRAGVDFTTTTDGNGDYSFPFALAGFYQVSVDVANATNPAGVPNVAVATGMVTDLDFTVDASELSYDSSDLVVTLGDSADMDTRILSISNPGNLPLNYTASVGGYDFGLPTAMSPLISGHRGFVGQPSSTGVQALLDSVKKTPRNAAKAPGDILFSAPLTGSALGITMAPDGTIWVADLFSGTTAVFDDALNSLGTINDPIGPVGGPPFTSGIAYDSVNDTLWWLSDNGAGSAVLVEGFRDGTATGNTITLPTSGLAAGVEYSELLDAFFYVDIGNDDIYAVNRSGTPLVGYPAPQTDLDMGQGLFGNGLDIFGNRLDVLATEVDIQPQAVYTDRFGNNLGIQTDLSATADNFVNDIVRSRLDPDGILYVVGNATGTLYAIEPTSRLLANQWAEATITSGTVAAGGSEDLIIDYDSRGLPQGEYQASLVVEGNFANSAPAKNLGLIVTRIIANPTSGLEVSEDGQTAQFTVVLGTRPTSDVVIPVGTSDFTEGLTDLNVVRFSPTDFDQPQTVTITGVDDSDADGDQAFTIILGETESADPAFDGADPDDIQVTNLDDDPFSEFVFADGFETP